MRARLEPRSARNREHGVRSRGIWAKPVQPSWKYWTYSDDSWKNRVSRIGRLRQCRQTVAPAPSTYFVNSLRLKSVRAVQTAAFDHCRGQLLSTFRLLGSTRTVLSLQARKRIAQPSRVFSFHGRGTRFFWDALLKGIEARAAMGRHKTANWSSLLAYLGYLSLTVNEAPEIASFEVRVFAACADHGKGQSLHPLNIKLK